MKPIIEIKNLAAGYDGRTVLHDVNLNVYERTFWASSVRTEAVRQHSSSVSSVC